MTVFQISLETLKVVENQTKKIIGILDFLCNPVCIYVLKICFCGKIFHLQSSKISEFETKLSLF